MLPMQERATDQTLKIELLSQCNGSWRLSLAIAFETFVCDVRPAVREFWHAQLRIRRVEIKTRNDTVKAHTTKLQQQSKRCILIFPS